MYKELYRRVNIHTLTLTHFDWHFDRTQHKTLALKMKWNITMCISFNDWMHGVFLSEHGDFEGKIICKKYENGTMGWLDDVIGRKWQDVFLNYLLNKKCSTKTIIDSA